MEWNTEYNGISIAYAEHWVRIKTDSQLLKVLSNYGNDSLPLASHLKKTYRSTLGKELQISAESLSVEILVHAYLDVLLLAAGELGKLLPKKIFKDLVACMEQLKGHTTVIDCGEKEVDSNRHIFDSLVPCRHLIYAVLGPLA